MRRQLRSNRLMMESYFRGEIQVFELALRVKTGVSYIRITLSSILEHTDAPMCV